MRGAPDGIEGGQAPDKHRGHRIAWQRVPVASPFSRTGRACHRCGERPRTTSDAWVYLLRCRDGSLYTGWTIDLDRRLARHQCGVASRYTASRLPVELAVAIPMDDRTAARREEARIKRLSRAAKPALLTSQTRL